MMSSSPQLPQVPPAPPTPPMFGDTTGVPTKPKKGAQPGQGLFDQQQVRQNVLGSPPGTTINLNMAGAPSGKTAFG